MQQQPGPPALRNSSRQGFMQHESCCPSSPCKQDAPSDCSAPSLPTSFGRLICPKERHLHYTNSCTSRTRCKFDALLWCKVTSKENFRYSTCTPFNPHLGTTRNSHRVMESPLVAYSGAETLCSFFKPRDHCMQATEPFLNVIYERDPLKRWTDGRVVLLGEAAHPTTSFASR